MRIVLLFGALVSREIAMTLHYRWWLAIMQANNLLTPTVSLLVWRGAVALGARPPVSLSFLTTYLVLVSVVSLLTSSWTANFLATGIRLGGVSAWLIRPCSVHLASLANNVAEKLIKVVLMAPMVGLLLVAFRRQLGLPADGRRWLLFAVSVLMAAGLAICIDIFIGSLAFWMEDISAIDRTRNLLSRTLSGALIPLALFPPALNGFLLVQPFRYIVSFPLEVLLGHPGDSLGRGFALQAGWLTLAVLTVIATWSAGLRNYQGASA